MALSSSATAIRAAATSYTQLLSSQSDNNIKLIVLERLQELKSLHPKVLQEMIMDIIRALSSANLDIRKKTLSIMLELVVPKNIGEVMQVLRKEVQKTAGDGGEKNYEYRALLINTIHSAAIKFPDSASLVVPVLMDFLGDENQSSAVEVVLFVREILELYPQLRDDVLTKLLNIFPTIHSSRVLRVALWLLGEYCVGAEDVAQAFTAVKGCLGELPFVEEGEEEAAAAAAEADKATGASAAASGGGRPVVLADGSYATQVAAAPEPSGAAASAASAPKLRTLLVGGDYFLATVVASTLVKLALRSRAHLPNATANMVTADVMLLLTGLLEMGTAERPGAAAGQGVMDKDSQERIKVFLNLLSSPGEDVQHLCLSQCHEAFAAMLADRKAAEAAANPPADAKLEVNRQADDVINVRQLRGRGAQSTTLDLEEDDDEMFGAVKASAIGELNFAEKLKRVTQLTGLSDPVYAEAYVLVHAYDILLDVLVINQTAEPMHNLCLEIATVGDLRLCERPQSYTLLPGENKHIKANIKVSSTETGIVFGSVVYDAQGAPPPPRAGAYGGGAAGGGALAAPPPPERHCVVLNDLHIDIMDYISPASCSDLAFRAMWAEFEWENKVAVNTEISEVKEFLEHVIQSTNMRCLTPPAALEGDAGFLAANLYAKSIFGEDALVNVSVEKRPTDGKICGYIRIRSKTQGIALSLGDKITLKQKGIAD